MKELKDRGILMTPANATATIEAIDAYLKPEASFVFLESEKTDLINLWQTLKGMIEKE